MLKLLSSKDLGWNLSIYTNTTILNAIYTNSDENGIDGNNVEQVPELLFKTGLTPSIKNFKASLLYSFTGEHFTDATNAERTPNAINGLVPSYWVIDLSLKYNWKNIVFEGGSNNLTDNVYFTRRADGYPGPGIIPASPRTWYITTGVNW